MTKPSYRYLMEQTADLDADMLGNAQLYVADVDKLAQLRESDKERATQRIVKTFEAVRSDFSGLEEEEITSASTELTFDGSQAVFLAMGRKIGNVGVYKAAWIENPGPTTVDDVYHGYVLRQALGGL